MVEVSKTTSFLFKSDIPKKSPLTTFQSGILHAYRSNKHPITPKQEHCFAWIANANGRYRPKKGNDSNTDYGNNNLEDDGNNDDESAHTHLKETMSYLERFGFLSDKAKFIPFSAKDKWIFKYPHAYPYVECNERGEVFGLPYWNPWANEPRTNKSGEPADAKKEANAVTEVKATLATNAGVEELDPADEKIRAAAITTAAASLSFTGSADGDPNKKYRRPALLSDKERGQLHIEMYDYFQWLESELTNTESDDGSTSRISKTGITLEGVRDIMNKMEDTFNVVKKRKDTTDIKADISSAPFLESILGPAMKQRLRQLVPNAKTTPKKRKAKEEKKDSPTPAPVKKRKKSISTKKLDFYEMYEKLVAFHAEHGHTSLQYGFKDDPQLGNWASYMRKKKKEYDDFMSRNEDSNSDEDDHDDNRPKTKESPPNMLTQDQIDKLNALDFAWTLAPKPRQRLTWEERLQELHEFYRKHGNFKVPRKEGSLGEWLHKQRQFYNANEERFMKHRYHKMLEIGFTFTKSAGFQKTWDERFDELVSFGRAKGHFNVPCPDLAMEDNETKGDIDEAEMEKLRFYKWVQKLKYDFNNAKLTKDRAQKLTEIGFDFS